MHEVGGAHTWGNMQSGTAVNALLRMSPFGGLSVERPILGGIADSRNRHAGSRQHRKHQTR
jgi:hypothetical protein